MTISSAQIHHGTSLKVDRRKFEEMAELDKKRYVAEAVKRMEGWRS